MDVPRITEELPMELDNIPHCAEAASDYRYTFWWLRWAADNAERADAW